MQLLVIVERFCAIISIYMSYAFNNQEVGKTIIINYTYWEKHIGKHVGRRTANNKIVDFKEKKVMYAEVNGYWS